MKREVILKNLIEFKRADFGRSPAHCFNKHIVFSYDNAIHYGIFSSNGFIYIRKPRVDLFYITNQESVDMREIGKLVRYKEPLVQKFIYFSEEIQEKNKLNASGVEEEEAFELVFDLKKMFSSENSTKLLRRGCTLLHKKGDRITVKRNGEIPPADKMLIYEEWVDWKLSNPKTYRASFSSSRYKRTFQFNSLLNWKDMVEYAYYIDNIPFALRVFSYNSDSRTIFDCAYMSRRGKKELCFVNDINNLIHIHSLNLVYEETQFDFLNCGRLSESKHLSDFKKRECSFHTTMSVFRYKIGKNNFSKGNKNTTGLIV